jgi:rubrerythrin
MDMMQSIFEYWVEQVKNSEKKLCNCCGFLCLDIEHICPRCSAYTFKTITKEELEKVPMEDIKLDTQI